MKITKSLFHKVCGVLCFLCIYSLPSYAQTELLVTYLDKPNEIFVMGEHGKLYFNETELIVDDNSSSPAIIPIATIQKIKISSIEDEVAIAENIISEQASAVLYPNPAGNYIYVKSSRQERLPVSIYSITGQMVLEGSFMSGEQINISHLTSGLYIVKMDKQTMKFSKL